MVICPRAELEGAVLQVKGEVLDFDLTGAFIDGWREPVDTAIEKDNDVGEDCNFINTISTVRKAETTTFLRLKSPLSFRKIGQLHCNN